MIKNENTRKKTKTQGDSSNLKYFYDFGGSHRYNLKNGPKIVIFFPNWIFLRHIEPTCQNKCLKESGVSFFFLLIEPAVLGLSPFDSKTCNEKCMWI